MSAKRQVILVLEFNHSRPELRKYGVLYRELGAVSRPGREGAGHIIIELDEE